MTNISIARLLYFCSIVFWCILSLNLLARPAFAYVDPGSGLFAFQVLMSILAGMSFLIRKRIRQLFSLCSKVFKGGGATKNAEL